MGMLDTIRSYMKLNGSEAKEEVKEHLEILARLGETKADYLKLKIIQELRSSGTSENEQVPIESILETLSKVFAVTKLDSDTIKDTITPLISAISPGVEENRKTSIATLITNLVSGFLGSSEGSENAEEHYVVYAEGNALIRLDVHLWEQRITSSGLTQNDMSSLLVMTYCKSAINVQKIKLNTFIALYQHQLAQTSTPMDLKEIARIKEIFEIFHNKDVR